MGHCLHFNAPIDATWIEAKNYCENFQGTLAKLDDANLLHEIYNHLMEEGK